MAAASTSAPAWPGLLRLSETKEKIANARVLCVGAGGIGCELLKTLVLSGFKHIEVIDLDTIETSNLNRQFLFRKHHVGSSKAATAADVIRAFAPFATIKAHHANVKDACYDLDFFRGFDIVLNGLDNLEARKHVNRLCLAAGRPLVESGTAGYLGQVTVHIKGVTECFECEPKPVPKTFPICTLRNTPDKPIHCVVWAKDLLFQRLFGNPEAVTDLDERLAAAAEGGAEAGGENGTTGDAAAGANGHADVAGASAAPPADDASFFVRQDGEAPLAYAQRVFDRLYAWDIERLLGVEEMWKSRAKPKPLRLADILPDASACGPAAGDATAGCASKALGLFASHVDERRVWDAADNARVFLKCVVMYHEQRSAELGSAVFDKDDDLAVDFVTAASNLRAMCYGIPTQTAFHAKGMAGNIIHAIATTNAIIAGFIVTEATKILAGATSACRSSYLYEVASNRRLIVAGLPCEPKPGCMVCGKAQLHLRINTATTLLSTLVDAVCKKRLSVIEPDLMCGRFVYVEGEGLEDVEVEFNRALLPRTLAALPDGGIRHGSIVQLSDSAQHFSVEIIVSHQEEWDEEKEPDGFALEGSVPAAAPAANGSDQAGTSAAAGALGAAESDDDLVVVEDGGKAPAAAAAAGVKRGRDSGAGSDGGAASKRAKAADGLATSAAAAAAADSDDDIVIVD